MWPGNDDVVRRSIPVKRLTSEAWDINRKATKLSCSHYLRNSLRCSKEAGCDLVKKQDTDAITCTRKVVSIDETVQAVALVGRLGHDLL